MATERARTWLGLAWLAAGVAVVVRLATLCARAVATLRPVGGVTLLERASQLKPAPWKTPWSALALAAYAMVLVGFVAVVWVVAVRRLRRDGKEQR